MSSFPCYLHELLILGTANPLLVPEPLLLGCNLMEIVALYPVVECLKIYIEGLAVHFFVRGLLPPVFLLEGTLVVICLHLGDILLESLLLR